MVLVAGACGTADNDAPSPTSSGTPTSETAPATDEPRIEAFAQDFDPGVTETLVALEEANGGQWTIEAAVTAIDTIRPSLVAGVDSPPPIDLDRLLFFLAQNYDELGDDQRSTLHALSAEPVTAVPAAYPAAESVAALYQPLSDVYQRLADQADDEFERLTGHRFPGVTKVFASDLGLTPVGSAGAYSSDLSFEPIRALFGDSSLADDVVDELYDLAAGGATLVCVIVVGGVFRARGAREQVAGSFHEVTHCHQHAVHPVGPVGFRLDPVRWMDEGYASWAGEAFAGGTSLSAAWWDTYHDGTGAVGGYNTTAGSYDGIAPFAYLHDNGADGWGSFVRWFNGVRANHIPDATKFSMLFDSIPAQARAGWAASSLQRSDLGALWTYTSGPGVGGSSRSRQPRPGRLSPGDSTSFAVSSGEQGTYSIDLDLAGEDAALLTMIVEAPGAVHWPWGVDDLATNSLHATWCFGPECTCEDGTELGPPVPAYTGPSTVLVAITGGGEFAAEFATPAEKCEEELPGFGPCPGGMWIADPEDAADLLLTLYEAAGLTRPTYVGGDITMSFFEDGAYRFDYGKLAFDTTIDGQPARFTLNGGSFGTWEADGSDLTVAIEDFDFTVTLTIEGVSQTYPSPPNTGGGSAPYQCADGKLLLDVEIAPLWPFPNEWTRIAS
jgi:hypothetical protein